ncbi:MAG: hypothetical protein LBE91_08085 [Tannerella sp.]|nr:hypothetical protein [Tannerella sp.]
MKIKAEMQLIRKYAMAKGIFMKAHNRSISSLNEKQWLIARTDDFMKWFGNWMELAAIKSRIAEWLCFENIEWAKGKSLEKINEKFGNILTPVAYIHPGYLKYLDENIRDNRVYSGKGYFINHVSNNHPEVSIKEYERIQEILDKPDEVKLDNRTFGRRSLIFIKRYDRYFAEVVSIDKDSDGKMIFYKTIYYKEKTPQKSLPNVELIQSLVNGLLTISPSPVKDEAAIPRNISARNDGAKIQNFLIIPKDLSKKVDKNGEPLASEIERYCELIDF